MAPARGVDRRVQAPSGPWTPYPEAPVPAPEPLSWSTLVSVALAAWVAGPGARPAAEADALDHAAGRVPLGPDALSVQSQVGLASQDQLQVGLELPLHGRAAGRARWSAEAAAVRAASDEGRLAWIEGAAEAWADWWVAEALAVDLDAYAAHVDTELGALSGAVDDGVLAPVALDDLRAELLQVTAEAGRMRGEAAVARARLEARLGAISLATPDPDAAPGADNPWQGLLDRGACMPGPRVATAGAALADAEARALVQARVPRLSVGPMWARDGDGSVRPFAAVGLQLPLQPGVASDRAAALGRAESARREAAWRATLAEGALREEATAWDALDTQRRHLTAEVATPLLERQARLEAALAQGLVTADRVTRAHRDAHEVEHALVVLSARMLASAARAEAVATLSCPESL